MGFRHRVAATIMTIGLLLVPVAALAADPYGIEATRNATGGLLPEKVAGAKNIPELVGAIVGVALSFLGIIFFGLIFYSGIRWMTARGNTDTVTEAKTTLESAVIGLIIVLASYAATQFVLDKLLVGATSSGAASVTGSSDAGG